MSNFLGDMFSDHASRKHVTASKPASSSETLTAEAAAARNRGYALRPGGTAQDYHGAGASVPQTEEEAAAARADAQAFNGEINEIIHGSKVTNRTNRGWAMPPREGLNAPFEYNAAAGETLPESVMRKIELEQLQAEDAKRRGEETAKFKSLFSLIDDGRKRAASPPGVRPKREPSPRSGGNSRAGSPAAATAAGGEEQQVDPLWVFPKEQQKAGGGGGGGARQSPIRDQSPKQQGDDAVYAPSWIQHMPTFSNENRYRPSETWAAVSPKFPPMEAVLGSYARAQMKAHEDGQRSKSKTTDSGPSTRGASVFDTSDMYSMQQQQQLLPSAATTAQRRSASMLTSDSVMTAAAPAQLDAGGMGVAVVDPNKTFSQIINNDVVMKEKLEHDQQVQQQMQQQEQFGMRSMSSATPNKPGTTAGGAGQKVNVFDDAVREMQNCPELVREADMMLDIASSCASGEAGGGGGRGGGGACGGVDAYDDISGIQARNTLQSLGKTTNPHSQRLFSGLAPEQFVKDRELRAAEEAELLHGATDKMEKEETQRDQAEFLGLSTTAPAKPAAPQRQPGGGHDAMAEAAHQYARVQRRSKNNLLPPTPFSQVVKVLNGPQPAWHRRLEAGRDLEAKASDSDSDSGEDDAVFDEFLRAEIEKAKVEQPRTEKRGDFYRLPIHEEQQAFNKIYDKDPGRQAQQDSNYAALEYLAISRPEMAPALRRLAPWQLHLIDWNSLFRGGCHEGVSVTNRQFPRGAAWDKPPWSEAPSMAGSQGFVGNIKKRDAEAEFFAKLHPSMDGRIDPDEMGDWLKRKAQVRFRVHDDPI